MSRKFLLFAVEARPTEEQSQKKSNKIQFCIGNYVLDSSLIYYQPLRQKEATFSDRK